MTEPRLSRGERRRRERILDKAHKKMRETAVAHAIDPDASHKAWRHWLNTLNQKDKSLVIKDLERIAQQTKEKIERDKLDKQELGI